MCLGFFHLQQCIQSNSPRPPICNNIKSQGVLPGQQVLSRAMQKNKKLGVHLEATLDTLMNHICRDLERTCLGYFMYSRGHSLNWCLRPVSALGHSCWTRYDDAWCFSEWQGTRNGSNSCCICQEPSRACDMELIAWLCVRS